MAKAKELKIDYRMVKGKHIQMGESRSKWKHLEAMNAVLGQRPATQPPVVLDTSDQPDDAKEEEILEQEAEEDEAAVDHSSMSTVPDNSDEWPVQTPEALATSLKGKKRRHTKDDKIEAVMMKVVKQVVDSQSTSDKILLDLEKWMKFEIENKRRNMTSSCT